MLYKNDRELKVCTNLLDIELLKYDQILSTQWVPSSFWSNSAVWNNYEATVLHLQAKPDSVQDKADSHTTKTIIAINFTLHLGLMYDALQELSYLGMDLHDMIWMCTW
jgi:hypothetical protein